MAWIDARAVKLGCIGFSKKKSTWNGALAACKKANSNAHLIEIFNDNQARFLTSEKVRKQVRTHIGIDSYGRYQWIGAKLKNGVWYWQHSKKRVTYWASIGANTYRTDRRHPYGCMYLSKTSAYYHWACGYTLYPICQISVNK